MAINKIPQRQVKSIVQDCTDLEQQLDKVEKRTSAKAKMVYDTKLQWDLGTKTNIDSDTILDQIQLERTNGGVGPYNATGQFLTYVIDTGGFDCSFHSLEFTQTKPAGTTVNYSTRSGNIDNADDPTWSDWQPITVDGRIQSPNARYVQVKISMTTNDTSVTPRVADIAVVMEAAPGVQELYDARGGYRTIAERLANLGNVYHLKVIPEDGQTDILLGKMVVDGTILKVYVNGSLQSEGSNEEDAYTIVNASIVRFNEGLSSDDLVICRIEGAGAGVITVKENRIVGEVPNTEDRISFVLTRTPVQGKEEVYCEGVKMTPGEDNDYTLEDNVITFNYAINESFVVRVTYLYI